MKTNKTKAEKTKPKSANTPTEEEIKKAEKEVEKLKKQQKNWNAMVEDILYPDDQWEDDI